MTFEQHLPQSVIDSASTQIQRDEGIGPYGLGTSYTDTAGVPTIGHGLNLNERGIQDRLSEWGYDVNAVIAGEQSVATTHLDQLFAENVQTAERIAFDYLPNLGSQPEPIQAAIVNMAYNLGENRLGDFQDLREALVDGNYGDAALAMMDSKWFDQVKDRGDRLVAEVLQVPDAQSPPPILGSATIDVRDPFSALSGSVFDSSPGPWDAPEVSATRSADQNVAAAAPVSDVESAGASTQIWGGGAGAEGSPAPNGSGGSYSPANESTSASYTAPSITSSGGSVDVSSTTTSNDTSSGTSSSDSSNGSSSSASSDPGS